MKLVLSSSSHLLSRLWLLVVLLLSAGLLSAQENTAEEASAEPGSVAETSEAAAAGTDDGTLIGTFRTGGPFMWPLLFFSIAVVALVIYNGLTVRERVIINEPALSQEVAPHLDELDFAAAMEACDRNRGPTINILRNGLETTESGRFDPVAMDKAFDEAASVQLAKPFVFVNYLQVIASVAPMVGLLGTVSGMVKAFRTIAEQGMGRPELLADNISEALITTATGLMVAVPALIAYFFFKNRYGRIASEVSQVLGRTLRRLTVKVENQEASAA